MGTGDDQCFYTRGVVFTLDPTPGQERLLRSYAGAARFAYNWAVAVGEVSENLSVRRAQRDAGVAEADLTPALSWSAFGLSKLWNETKTEVAPWWQEVSMHAFRSGIRAVADALGNFSDSKKGERKGTKVGFPHRKSRRRSTPSVSFVEINHQLSWLNPNRHGVRLMLPQSTLPGPSGPAPPCPSPVDPHNCVDPSPLQPGRIRTGHYPEGHHLAEGRSLAGGLLGALRGQAGRSLSGSQGGGASRGSRRWSCTPGHPVGSGAWVDRRRGPRDQSGHPLPTTQPSQEARLRRGALRAWIEEPSSAPQAPGPPARNHRQDSGSRAAPRDQRARAPLRGHRDRGP